MALNSVSSLSSPLQPNLAIRISSDRNAGEPEAVRAQLGIIGIIRPVNRYFLISRGACVLVLSEIVPEAFRVRIVGRSAPMSTRQRRSSQWFQRAHKRAETMNPMNAPAKRAATSGKWHPAEGKRVSLISFRVRATPSQPPLPRAREGHFRLRRQQQWSRRHAYRRRDSALRFPPTLIPASSRWI